MHDSRWKVQRVAGRALAGVLLTVPLLYTASLAVAPAAGAATTWTVTNCNDSGSGSLRAAVQAADADSGDTVVFSLSPSCSLVTLTSGESR